MTKTEEEAAMLQEQMLLHPDTVQDHEIVTDLIPHDYVKDSDMIGTNLVILNGVWIKHLLLKHSGFLLLHPLHVYSSLLAY